MIRMVRDRRLVVDMILFVLLTTIFKRHVISANYHVWAGMLFCGLLAGHVWLNRAWLRRFTAKRKKESDWLSFVLLFVFAALLITGILTAKPFGIELNYLKPYHKCLGGLSLLLVSAHIGFHWQYLRVNFLRSFRVLRLIPQAVTTLLLIGALCLGGYGFVNSGFAKWMTAPFTATLRVADAAARPRHQLQPFDWERLGKSMAELAGMMFLGAYVVKSVRKPPGRMSRKE